MENEKDMNDIVTSAFEAVKWLFGEPIINFTQSIVDDSIKVNADFHGNAGLSPKIQRKAVGKACKWCQALVGSYNFPDVPHDVYRRHQNCRCTVDYDPKDGSKKVSDVWSKKLKNQLNNDLQEKRKLIGIKEDDTKKPYVSVKDEWLKGYQKRNAKVIVADYFEKDGQKYIVDGKNIVLDYSKNEKEVADWLAKKFGVEVQMVPRVNYPNGIKTPDYLINGVPFDLKEITGNGKNVLDGNLRKVNSQANNIIFDVTQSNLSDKNIYLQLEDVFRGGKRKVDTIILKRDDQIIDVITKRNRL